ncbi:helix-turn-helix domain-containing protein [Prolixibacter denitrificans]|nr:helix-turn-helix transcriptional regulator [Prolixibacter denitrificans]GET21849.1 AraC family transcriptional regulator [Prolixibacter denitrificans]
MDFKMEDAEKLEEFYQRKFDWIPDNIHNDLGHFNVFRVEPFTVKPPRPVPYRRRDYYKVTLIIGESTIHYADRVLKIGKQALVFSNPQIPYKWEHSESMHSGYYCIFNQHFFRQYGNPEQYEVYQPNGLHVFDLSDEQVAKVSGVYERMFEEINSDYIHKYDVLRNLVFELLHFAMKMQPNSNLVKQQIDANQRISTLFMELLERQFPIDDSHPKINLRSASDFATQLNVHVNHLNRAIKNTAQKTTTQLISDRILQESKVMLKHSSWNISEIAYALGFSEVTHFNNFFKKHTEMTPTKFRNV